MKRILFSTVLIVTVAAITLHSCKKDEVDTETQSAVDNNICETEFTKMMPRVNSFGINEQGVKMPSACPMITSPDTVASPGWPRTMIVDYGTTGCTDSIDGKVRTGQIILEFSNRWHFIGTTVKITLVNYTVNSVMISCDSIRITHSGVASFGTRVFKGRCQSASWDLSWESDRTITQTGGLGDFNPYNDVFELSGSANGKNRDGKTYTVSIVSPIVKRSSCKWIEKGTMDLTPDGLATRTIDFGDGTCDDQATLEISGNTFAFTMD